MRAQLLQSISNSSYTSSPFFWRDELLSCDIANDRCPPLFREKHRVELYKPLQASLADAAPETFAQQK